MAVSLNSVITFNPTANYRSVMRSKSRVLSLNAPTIITSCSRPVKLKRSAQEKISRFNLLATGGDIVATGTTVKDSKPIEASNSNDGPSPNASDVNSSATDNKIQPSDEVSELSNGTAKSSPGSKQAPLTARERLRAARVLNRYNESKPSKGGLGNNLLESLRESDKGKKRPGLPEAPTNLFDDSKRGMPKEGWTIDIPGGMDVFLIVFSFVFISSVMFATTYVVWKVGAIHFNEY